MLRNLCHCEYLLPWDYCFFICLLSRELTWADGRISTPWVSSSPASATPFFISTSAAETWFNSRTYMFSVSHSLPCLRFAQELLGLDRQLVSAHNTCRFCLISSYLSEWRVRPRTYPTISITSIRYPMTHVWIHQSYEYFYLLAFSVYLSPLSFCLFVPLSILSLSMGHWLYLPFTLITSLIYSFIYSVRN